MFDINRETEPFIDDKHLPWRKWTGFSVRRVVRLAASFFVRSWPLVEQGGVRSAGDHVTVFPPEERDFEFVDSTGSCPRETGCLFQRRNVNRLPRRDNHQRKSRQEVYATDLCCVVLPMPTLASLYRARVLAVVFGSYLAFVIFASSSFASGLADPLYSPAVSRDTYAAYLMASSAFLVGLAVIASLIQGAFDGRVRDVNRALGTILLGGGAAIVSADILPPSLRSKADPGQSDLNEILETLGETQNQEVLLVSSSSAGPEARTLITLHRALLHRREELGRRQLTLMKFFPGPSAVAVAFIALSAVMLSATDPMLFALHSINTTLILGFAYGWVGLAAYFALSMGGAVRGVRMNGKHPTRRSTRSQAKEEPVAARSRPRVARSGR